MPGRNCCWFFLLLSVCAVTETAAQDLTLSPELEVSCEYDDNLLFSRTGPIEDGLLVASPALELDYRTALMNLSAVANLDFWQYLDESDLNTVKQLYGINAGYQLGPRWRTSADFSFIKDETLDTYLAETGRVTRREDRSQYRAGGGVSWELSPLTQLVTRYSYYQTAFDNPEDSDYDRHTIQLTFKRRMKSQTDFLTLTPAYYHRRSDVNQVDNYSLAFGWLHRWSEVTDINVYLGPRYTSSEPDNGREDESWGVVAGIGLQRQAKLSTTDFGYYHELSTTVGGAEIQVDRLLLRHDQKLTRRLGIGLAGRLIFSDEAIDDQAIRDQTYYQLEPYFFYLWTEHIRLNWGYTYQHNENDELERDKTADRNRVWISLTFRCPMPL